MRQVSSFAVLIFFVVAGIGAALAYAEFNPANSAPERINRNRGPADRRRRCIRNKDCSSVGKGGGPAVRAIPFSKGTGIVLHEGLKQNSTIVIVPSTAVETMQLGGLAGLATFSMGLAKKTKMAMRRNTGPQGASEATWGRPII